MSDKQQNNFKDNDPYRFDLTAEFLRERYKKISSNKSRIETEQKIRKENSKN